MDAIPVWVFFGLTIVIVVVAIEIGYRLGSAIHKRSTHEKISPVSAISASILGLLAFMLAFSFGMVGNRYDARKELIRNEANAIGTTYLRADFLSEPSRSESKKLLREYLNDRIIAVQSNDDIKIRQAIENSEVIQHRLWDMAVEHARKEMNSDILSLYIDSLNNTIDIHSMRIAVAMQTRAPAGVWVVLYILAFFGMISVGYQTAIAGSKRSIAALILSISFALVLTLIVILDRPQGKGGIIVTQQPLIDLRNSIDSASK